MCVRVGGKNVSSCFLGKEFIKQIIDLRDLIGIHSSLRSLRKDWRLSQGSRTPTATIDMAARKEENKLPRPSCCTV